MDLREKIWDWIKERPDWQSDLLRRLYSKGELDLEDFQEVKHNLLLKKSDSIKGRTIEKDDITAANDGSNKILLKSLKNVKHVGNLVHNGVLDFNTNGITIIYGENGAGKSSYARILKKACRAVHEPDQIHSNIYDEKIKEGEAIIEIVQDGKARLINRKVNDSPDPKLRSISVYDKNCSDIYLDNSENEIPYAPQDLRIFSKLSSQQDRIADELRKDIRTKEKYISAKEEALEDFPNDSSIYPIIKNLSHETTIQKLESLKGLGKSEKKELKRKQKELQDIDEEDVKKQIKKLEALKRECIQIETTVTDGHDQFLNKIKKGTYKTIIEDFEDLKEAEKHIKQKLHGEPLEGVGEGSWKELWEAAKRYSEEFAYPKAEFPITESTEEDGARCVLCQQELNPEGIKRFKRFEEFVKDDISRKLKSKKIELDQLINDLKQNTFVISLGETLKTHLQEEQEKLLTEIQAYNKKIEELRIATLKALENRNWSEKIKKFETEKLQNLIGNFKKSIEGKISQKKTLFDKEEIKKINDRVIELTAKESLEKRFNSIKEIIKGKKEIYKLERAIKNLKTTAISRFQNQLVSEILAPDIDDELQKQLKILKCDHLPVSIEGRSTKGNPISQVKYDYQRKNIPVKEILSEGEQNGFSLAYFLTEVSQAGHNSPFIFDDPVTSLDHQRREYVAKKIVNEVREKNRQAIVFTHDIVFLLELEQKASTDVDLKILYLNQTNETSGNVIDEQKGRPWISRSTNQRIKFLRNELQEFRKMKKEGFSEIHLKTLIKGWYVKLREVWERAVEELVLGDVIHRFRLGIETSRLNDVQVSPEIIKEVDLNMAECSNKAHDQAPERNSPLPDFEEMEDDVKKVDDFRKKLQSN
ncbi:MAG: AAA family ATPase [Balneolaceae bacterium]